MVINKAKLEFADVMSKRRATDTICLHHTGTSQKQSVEVIHNYHRYTNGWAGIGYHYYVRKDGSVWYARPDDLQGAHSPAINDVSVAICFEGNFETEKMSDLQLNAGKEIIAYVMKKYPSVKRIVRHSDVSPTACPGKNFPFKKLKNYGDVQSKPVSSGDVDGESFRVYSHKILILTFIKNSPENAVIWWISPPS